MPDSKPILLGNFREAAKRVRDSERDEAVRVRVLRKRQAATAGKAQRWREAREALPSLW